MRRRNCPLIFVYSLYYNIFFKKSQIKLITTGPKAKIQLKMPRFLRCRKAFKYSFTFLVLAELRSIVYEFRYKKNGKREISKGGVCRSTEYLTGDNGTASQKRQISHKKPQNWIKKILLQISNEKLK